MYDSTKTSVYAYLHWVIQLNELAIQDCYCRQNIFRYFVQYLWYTGVHLDLFRLLHAVMHGTKALVYSNHCREAAASTCLAIINLRADCHRRTLVIPFNSCANAAPLSTVAHRCHQHYCKFKNIYASSETLMQVQKY